MQLVTGGQTTAIPGALDVSTKFWRRKSGGDATRAPGYRRRTCHFASVVNRISSAARNSPSRGPLNRMAAIADAWGAFTVSRKNGMGSAGALRPGTAATDALSTTTPLL